MQDYRIIVLPIYILVALLAGLTFIIAVDPYIRRDQRRVLFLVMAATSILIAQSAVEYRLSLSNVRVPLHTSVAILGYSLRPAILALLIRLVAPGKRRWAVWALVACNALVHLTALFSGICFGYHENNDFYRGPLGYTSFVISGVLLARLLFLTLWEFRRVRQFEALIPVINAGLIVLAVVLDLYVYEDSFLVSCTLAAIVISVVFFYTWLHLQFVREHERVLREEQRLQIMLSQIKPHFLYNSLGAIESLCESDPPAARAATVQFAQYLRGNMDSLSQEGEIPFAKELEHTRLYLQLEQLRFEDVLRVRYDIACADFSIPPLTLEPLAENAVRHGVRGNPDGRGTVVISTREYADRYEVSVTDDGPGFDPKAVDTTSGAHIGIQNVRDRLGHMRGGALRIESLPGGGTTATIVLPRTKEARAC